MNAYVLIIITCILSGCIRPQAEDADKIVQNIAEYAGKRVVMKARLRSGARCRQEGKWQTYCKDCQYCRGPIVIDTTLTSTQAKLDDWPMIIGGTWKGRDIRCKGPLNAIDCYPFTLGKTYILRGQIEHRRPAKLLLEDFWEP